MARIYFVCFLFLLLESCTTTQQVNYSDNSLLIHLPKNEKSVAIPNDFIEFNISDSILDTHLHGFYKVSDSATKCILYFHGNGENLWSNNLHKKLNIITDAGYNLIAIDYPNYGLSKGHPTIESLLISAQLTYNQTRTIFPEDTLILWGHSLGSIPAIYMAVANYGDYLVSEGTITNLLDLEEPLENSMSKTFKKTDLIISEKRRFDNSQLAKSIYIPSFLIHGDTDEIANFNKAKSLFHNISADQKQFFTLVNEGHSYKKKESINSYLLAFDTFMNKSPSSP